MVSLSMPGEWLVWLFLGHTLVASSAHAGEPVCSQAPVPSLLTHTWLVLSPEILSCPPSDPYTGF